MIRVTAYIMVSSQSKRLSFASKKKSQAKITDVYRNGNENSKGTPILCNCGIYILQELLRNFRQKLPLKVLKEHCPQTLHSYISETL
jgi:hypothetical protein